MKKLWLLLFLVMFMFPNFSFAKSLMGEGLHFKDNYRQYFFVEDFFSLYKSNLQNRHQNLTANIFYLQCALYAAKKNRFQHPVKSPAYQRYDWSENPYTKEQHEQYKRLMMFKICHLLTKDYVALGSRFDKQNIFWFSYQFYKEIKTSMTWAKDCYEKGLAYWNETKNYAQECFKYAKSGIDLQGPNMDAYEDEVFKICMQNNKRYKEEMKDYYYRSDDKNYPYNNYPEYNYDKAIREKIDACKVKLQNLETLREERMQGIKKDFEQFREQRK